MLSLLFPLLQHRPQSAPLPNLQWESVNVPYAQGAPPTQPSTATATASSSIIPSPVAPHRSGSAINVAYHQSIEDPRTPFSTSFQLGDTLRTPQMPSLQDSPLASHLHPRGSAVKVSRILQDVRQEQEDEEHMVDVVTGGPQELERQTQERAEAAAKAQVQAQAQTQAQPDVQPQAQPDVQAQAQPKDTAKKTKETGDTESSSESSSSSGEDGESEGTSKDAPAS